MLTSFLCTFTFSFLGIWEIFVFKTDLFSLPIFSYNFFAYSLGQFVKMSQSLFIIICSSPNNIQTLALIWTQSHPNPQPRLNDHKIWDSLRNKREVWKALSESSLCLHPTTWHVIDHISMSKQIEPQGGCQTFDRSPKSWLTTLITSNHAHFQFILRLSKCRSL